MVKCGAYQLSVVLFTKENIDVDKPIPVVNIPPVSFIGGPITQVILGIIQGYWDPERLVAVITMVDVPVEEYLDYIGMKAIKVVIHMECYCEASWINSLGEVQKTQIIYQWVDWLTNP